MRTELFSKLIKSLDLKRSTNDQIRQEIDKLTQDSVLRKILLADLCECGPMTLVLENPNWLRIRIQGNNLNYKLVGDEQWRRIDVGFVSDAAALMATQRIVAKLNCRLDDDIPVQRLRLGEAVV